jgi:hypothetical protein
MMILNGIRRVCAAVMDSTLRVHTGTLQIREIFCPLGLQLKGAR